MTVLLRTRKPRGQESVLARVREACALEHTAIFFAEAPWDWAHIGPLADRVEYLGKRVLRLTADPEDPVITTRNGLFVGGILSATRLFLSLPRSVVVMTMTDLDIHHLKRSVNDVHYVYVFHSLVSTHRAYRSKAFDAYDSILCSGPHHFDELTELAGIRDIRPQKLYETGYCRLDDFSLETTHSGDSSKETIRVLLVPTWGESSLIEYNLEQIITDLLDQSIEVVLRFHPMSLRHQPQLKSRFQERFGQDDTFSIDDRMESTEAFRKSDIALTEWSGAAHEFSFGLLRPSIFINTPNKSNTDDRTLLSTSCFEDLVRGELGAAVELADSGEIPDVVRDLRRDATNIRTRLDGLRSQHIYNPNRSVTVAADQLLEMLN